MGWFVTNFFNHEGWITRSDPRWKSCDRLCGKKKTSHLWLTWVPWACIILLSCFFKSYFSYCFSGSWIFPVQQVLLLWRGEGYCSLSQASGAAQEQSNRVLVICRRNHYIKIVEAFHDKIFISHSLVFNDCLSIIYMQRCGSGSRYGYGTYCLNLEDEENFIMCDKFFFMALVSKSLTPYSFVSDL